MRFLTVDSKNNIIHSSASAVSADKFTINCTHARKAGRPYACQINGKPAIGELSVVPFSTKRGKRRVKK